VSSANILILASNSFPPGSPGNLIPFISLLWIKENVKTLGVHHGYNVDNDKIWKDIIDRMKNCIQVWGNLIPFISLFPLIAHAMGSACNM
jgi:hypothetical protein